MKRASTWSGLLIVALALTALPAFADSSQLQVSDLTQEDLDPAALATLLASEDADDVAIVDGSVGFTGDDQAAGAFIGGGDILGFDDGIILSSGRAADVVGPNESPATTTAFELPGDAQLSDLAGFQTFDATILEFEFEVPEGAEEVFFTYVFGSEEYNEYVASEFNDVFAFEVNDVNCAVVGEGDPVSINTINGGNVERGFDPVNPELYINNDPFNGDLATPPFEVGAVPLNTEMDGFTVPLTCQADVDPDVTNTMRLAIADTSDEVLDSWVLIQAGSLSITPPTPPEPDDFTVSLDGFAETYEQGSSGTGEETARFTYTRNDGDIEQVFNVFTIDGFTTLDEYLALFAELDYDPYIRGLQGTDVDNVVAPETRDVPLDFTLQDDAPVGDYTLRLTSYDVTNVEPTEVSLSAALAGEYPTLDADDVDAAVITLAVRNPAAPAVAARLLREADIDVRYGRGRNGGNHITNVAGKMTEDRSTDFNGVPKTAVLAYECEVATFLRSGDVGPVAEVSDAACPDLS